LLNTIHNWTEPELIIEVMRGVPAVWNTIVDSANMVTIQELASAMEYFNDQLIRATDYDNGNILRRIKDLEKSLNRGSHHKARTNEVETVEVEAETNLIGQKPNNFSKSNFATPNKPNFSNATKPKYPPADNVISKGRTPAEAGGRPCRHCNSSKHWDYDCPHSDFQKKKKVKGFKSRPFKRKFNRFKKKFRKAQTKFINQDEDSWEATANFIEEELDQSSSAESSNSSESSSESEESEEQEDF